MQEKKSLKLLAWSKRDIFAVAFVYVINFMAIAGLFLVMAYFNSKTADKPFTQLLSDSHTLVNCLMLLFLFVGIIALYFYFEDRNFLRRASNSEMLFLIVELSLMICYVSGKLMNMYVRPLVLATVLTLFLTNSKTAIFMNFMFGIITYVFDSISGMMTDSSGYSAVFFLVMGLSSSTIAVYSLKNVYSRLKLLLLSFLVSAPAVVCTLLPIIDFGSHDKIYLSLGSALASGPLATILFIALLPFFEWIFKKASYFKYAEFTDHKSRLIRKMITQAPGTFNHAIVVSNIAEACATAIEEDALLARVCAYYHDIGKLRRPEFFMENQGDIENPHDDLTPELSVNIIKSHATDGYQLLKKNRLPDEIVDVCTQHHGTLPIIYFYDKARKFTDGEVSLSQFCYPGPKPQTKIAAIIMIADGCEAASRTLKDRSRENVYKVVKKIVNDRMSWGQFDECEITLKELNIIINTVVNSLTGVYHSRIEYPKITLDGADVEERREERKERK